MFPKRYSREFTTDELREALLKWMLDKGVTIDPDATWIVEVDPRGHGGHGVVVLKGEAKR